MFCQHQWRDGKRDPPYQGISKGSPQCHRRKQGGGTYHISLALLSHSIINTILHDTREKILQLDFTSSRKGRSSSHTVCPRKKPRLSKKPSTTLRTREIGSRMRFPCGQLRSTVNNEIMTFCGEYDCFLYRIFGSSHHWRPEPIEHTLTMGTLASSKQHIKHLFSWTHRGQG